MLDVSVRVGVLNLMRRLRDERDIAMLYITHDLGSARYLADTTMVMFAGELVEGGDEDVPAHQHRRHVSPADEPLRCVVERQLFDRGFAAVVDPALRPAWVRKSRQADYQAVLQSVLASVVQTYFTHLRNLRRLEVLDANIARARTLLELARNQLNAGVATQIDVTRRRGAARAGGSGPVATGHDRSAERAAAEAGDRYSRLPASCGWRIFNVQRSDGKLLMFAEDTTTFEKRADILRAQKALNRHGSMCAPPRSSGCHRCRWVVRLGAARQISTTTSKPQWSATAAINLPIFDGLRAGRIAGSRCRASNSQEMRVHNLELQISSELRLAAQDASSRNAQIPSPKKA